MLMNYKCCKCEKTIKVRIANLNEDIKNHKCKSEVSLDSASNSGNHELNVDPLKIEIKEEIIENEDIQNHKCESDLYQFYWTNVNAPTNQFEGAVRK